MKWSMLLMLLVVLFVGGCGRSGVYSQLEAARPDFSAMPASCRKSSLIFHDETGYDREMAIAAGKERTPRPHDRKRPEFERPPIVKKKPKKEAKRPPFVPGTEKTDRGPED
jgi:hypothetical protein